MAFKIIRNDITKVCADAIVNTANPKPIIGQGTDTAIYKACGQEELLAARNLENSMIYKKAFVDRKFFSKIIGTKDYIPKKPTVMAFGLALELKLDEYESFLASAGYAFMPSSKFDMIIKYCVINRIYNLIDVNMNLYSCGEENLFPVL